MSFNSYKIDYILLFLKNKELVDIIIKFDNY